MAEFDKDKYDNFFKDYRGFESKHWSESWKKEKSDYQAFHLRYQRHKGQVAEIFKRDSPNYDIFSILGLGRYEERLHSPFLANLLNPKGTHGQGSLFLNAFLKSVINPKEDFCYEDMIQYQIKAEFNFPTMPKKDPSKHYKPGKIDIFIRCNLGGKRIAIIIENKIYAGDQEEQLIRYENYALNGLDYKKEEIYLMYLTPKNQDPSAISYFYGEWKKGSNQDRHFSITYSHHIKRWLSHCINDVRSEQIQFILKQYLKTISKL